MDYLERAPERRSRPTELLPGAKSVIALAMKYSVPKSSSPAVAGRGSMDSAPEAVGNDGREGRVARYALGKDYHKVINKKLEAFTRYLAALAPKAEYRTFVDTGPLLERAFAQRAGIGFIGKNTMVITKGLGSWVFLASVITTLDLPLDAPDVRSCGECRLCIDACPTQAISAPFELDARRCISYLTIEHDGPIDPDLRGKTEGWIFGCDICQEVCPHNVPNRHSLRSLAGNPSLPITLAEILSISSDEEFHQRFAGTPLTRAGRTSLVRNACLAAANLSRKDLLPQLEELAQNDPSPLVREHAQWALDQLLQRV
jgi:epoxyqueuosine reductase